MVLSISLPSARNGQRAGLPSASPTGNYHAASSVPKPRTFPPAPINAWNLPIKPRPNDSSLPKRPILGTNYGTPPESVLALPPNRSIELDTSLVRSTRDLIVIVPAMPSKDYLNYERMIKFILEFNKLPYGAQLLVFKEFKLSSHQSDFLQRTFYHIINHDMWHLSSGQHCCTDLDRNTSHWNTSDRLHGIALPMNRINRNPHLFNLMGDLVYCYSPILCAREVPMGRYYKATAIQNRMR
jgi:hypothetical protein